MSIRVTGSVFRADSSHTERFHTMFVELRQLPTCCRFGFSLLPLRLATLAGLTTAALGVVAFLAVLWLWFANRGPGYGFGWLMAAFLIFSGTQLVMLGLIGEYLGRMFLTVNQRPQAVVREVISGGEQ